MAITTEELAGGITKVILEGRLDVENSPAVDLRMNAIAGARKSILVDLQNVSFLGSMGLRALVAPALALQGRGGKMVLFGPNELVTKVLKVSGIETMIPVHHELQSALAALQ
jgi:anti-sigma B factor antagonist